MFKKVFSYLLDDLWCLCDFDVVVFGLACGNLSSGMSLGACSDASSL